MWNPDDHDYAIIDWRIHRYLAVAWDIDGMFGGRVVIARVQEVELRHGRPVITATDLDGRRELVLDPKRDELRKCIDGEEVVLGRIALVEAPKETDLGEQYHGVDGYEPSKDVQSGLSAWGVSV